MEFLPAHENDTFTESTLITKVQHAEEEITKDGEPYKTVKLTYLTLSYKPLKKHLRFLITDNDYSVHDIIVVITDDKFIKYIQVNFLDDSCDEDSKYKPYIRFYREKVFHTEKKPNKKSEFPKMINVSTEMKTISDDITNLKASMFKLIYKIIKNTNGNTNTNDKFKRKIRFL
jgi:hypothetical protein